jgi:N6-L-threonylcarbamoyladenine synthase
MICLGIETTCDETSVSIVTKDFTILSNVIHSQVPLHTQFGGVFPELAAREHLEKIVSCYHSALKEAGVKPDQIDLIAVAYGPGLIGSIQVGLTFGKTLALELNVPFVAVNHIHAHLIAPLIDDPKAFELFPALGLVLSGGHTQINWMNAPLEIETVGSTIDDAMGECFDKCAKMCGLPYPGGPHVERLAKLGNPDKLSLKPCRVKEQPLAFSYSGLKTQVLYALKDPSLEKNDLLAAFQKVVFTDLYDKVKKALKIYPAKSVFVGGGVAASNALRAILNTLDVPVFFPSKALSLDNGAMIAAMGILQFKKQGASPIDIEPKTRIQFPQAFACT